MIIVKAYSTREAEIIVYNNLASLGEINSIKHSRRSSSIFFETIIEGDEKTLKIEGGLSSGYQGEGSDGLVRVLKKLGVDENVAHEKVKGNSDNSYSFEIHF